MAQSGAAVKLTTARIAEELLRRRGNVTAAAKALRCDRRTLHRKIERSPKLQEALHEAREERLDYVESKFDSLIDKGYWPAIRFYLETQGRSRGYIVNLSSQANHAS